MDDLSKLTRQIGELTALLKNQQTDDEATRKILADLRAAFVEQSGAMAVVAAEAVANRKEVEENKKKSLNLIDLSSYWQKRFRNLKAREKEAGRGRPSS